MAVTDDGMGVMPFKVPLAGRAAWTLETVHRSAREAAVAEVARTAKTVYRVNRCIVSE